MMRRVVKNAWLVVHILQVLRMLRREPIVPTGLNMKEFVKGITVAQPRCALLISAEKISVAVDGQSD